MTNEKANAGIWEVRTLDTTPPVFKVSFTASALCRDQKGAPTLDCQRKEKQINGKMYFPSFLPFYWQVQIFSNCQTGYSLFKI